MAFVAHFMATGSAFYIFNAFMQPLVEQRGWTYTQINRSLMLGPAVAIVSQLFYGTMVYRVGPRAIMTAGPLVAGIFFILLGRVETIWGFYLCHVLLCVGNGGMNGITATTAVNNWFARKRGTALGLSTSGISLSGVIVPLVALLILEKTDLVHAYQWIGCVILLVSPLAWLVIRDTPEKHGMFPDGLPPEREPSPTSAGNASLPVSPHQLPAAVSGPDDLIPRWTLRALLGTGAFWKLGFSYAMILSGVSGLMSQLKPRFSHMGFDDRTAMLMMAATALLGTFGKFFWGTLCDRFDARRVVAALVACGAAGIGIMLAADSFPMIVLFILVYGFAMGGVMSTLPIIVADLFGRTSFASVAKFMPLFFVMQGIGPEAMGQSMDRTGSYDYAYMMFIALNVLAVFLVLSIRRPRRERGS
jgi:OFA family oxalate/formate antiporter-like MFS transporter